MDTDDLSKETYEAVIIASENFNSDLPMHFGLLADNCNDEDEFLLESKRIIQQWRNELDFYHENLFFEEPKPSKANFSKILIKIEKKIERVIEIPMIKRQFDF